MMTTTEHVARCMVALLAAAAVSGCASLRPPGALPLGTPIAEARQSFAGPRDEYALPGGGTRLEFRQGRQTYLLVFDAGGILVSSRQVLTPETFATITLGMSQDEVLARIGRPAFVTPIGWQRVQLWSYRFGGLEGDCVVFQVSITNATQRVYDTGPNMDPACDHGARD